jgi:hypothetical protein
MKEQNVSRCRWACPTLYLPPPIWMYAWDAPWTCLRSPFPRVLGASEDCLKCPRWEAPAEAEAVGELES